MSFSFEKKTDNKRFFLDIKVGRQDCNFIRSTYRKPTFNEIYSHSDSFLLDSWKFRMIYMLVLLHSYRCFSICSSWSSFYEELIFLKEYFLLISILINFVLVLMLNDLIYTLLRRFFCYCRTLVLFFTDVYQTTVLNVLLCCKFLIVFKI